MDILTRRVVSALTIAPSGADWIVSAILVALLGILLVPAGLRRGFLTLRPLRAPAATILGVLLGTLLLPALAEELLFRAVLLPHPTEDVPAPARWLWGCGSVAAFVVYHPLNALRHAPAKRAVLTDPAFLGMAGLLGAACSAAYLASGSLWPPVAIHWVVVAVWLLLLGGYRKLYPDGT